MDQNIDYSKVTTSRGGTFQKEGDDWIYVVPEDFMYRVNFEVASWYNVLDVKAGRYKANEPYLLNGRYPYRLSVSIPCVILDAYTPTLFGGVPMSDGRSDIGKIGWYSDVIELEKANVEGIHRGS